MKRDSQGNRVISCHHAHVDRITISKSEWKKKQRRKREREGRINFVPLTRTPSDAKVLLFFSPTSHREQKKSCESASKGRIKETHLRFFLFRSRSVFSTFTLFGGIWARGFTWLTRSFLSDLTAKATWSRKEKFIFSICYLVEFFREKNDNFEIFVLGLLTWFKQTSGRIYSKWKACKVKKNLHIDFSLFLFYNEASLSVLAPSQSMQDDKLRKRNYS